MPLIISNNSAVITNDGSSSDIDVVFFGPVSHNEVATVFMSLNYSRSVNAPGIQIKPVKYILGTSAHCIAYICNVQKNTANMYTKLEQVKR